MGFVVLHGEGCRKSAKFIGQTFHLPVRRRPRDNDRVVIRWGTSRHAREGRNGAINPRRAIYLASQKLTAYQKLADNNILVPTIWHSVNENVVYPCLSRLPVHRQGRDIKLINTPQEAEVDLRQGRHLVELLPVYYEYRVHVLSGRPLRVFRKIPRSDDADDLIKTARLGWGFRRLTNPLRVLSPMLDLAVATMECLGLVFGAIDIIRTPDNRFYILEANTAPSLADNESTRQVYLNYLGEWLEENYDIESLG